MNRKYLLLLALFSLFVHSACLHSCHAQVKLTSFFQTHGESREGTLTVLAEIEDDWHLYSVSTPLGGPKRTRMSVLDSDQFQQVGPFEPAEDPHLLFEDVFEILVEEHEGTVSWSAPIQLKEGVSPEDLEINLKFEGQACDHDGLCIMVNEKLSADFEGELPKSQLQQTYEPARSHVVWTGTISPATAQPGDHVTLTLTAKPTEGYKIYGYSSESTATVAQPTRIALARSHGWGNAEFKPSEKPGSKDVAGETQYFHKGKVSWTMDLVVPADAAERTYQFEGRIGYQNCTDEMCDAPAGAKFVFEVAVGEGEEKSKPVEFAKSGSYRSASQLADRKHQERKTLKAHSKR